MICRDSPHMGGVPAVPPHRKGGNSLMLGYIAKRTLQALFVLFVLTAFVFSLLHLSGDPAALLLPADATPEQIQQMREWLGLDQPIAVQYIRYLARLVHGDLGCSYRMNLPVLVIIRKFLPNTLLLGVFAILFATLLSLPLGVIAAVKRDSPVDFLATFIATLGQSMPTFWLAILLILAFGVKLRLLPVSGIGSWKHFILPVISLGWYSTALLTRVLRSSMVEVLNMDYVTVARSKGLHETSVVLKHALRNASLPVLTVWGLQLGTVLMGSVATETVFAWPGIGRLTVEAILGRDYPVVLGAVLVFGTLFVFINTLVDLVYCLLDPRISYT